MAALNFSGPAAIWLQSIQKCINEFDSDAFTSLLGTHFGRDRHQMLIRQFFTIHQTTSVADYIERFESVMNHLVSYADNTHPYFYLTHFVMGLRVDIRALLLTRWPPDMNTACLLALLQDEVVDAKHHPHTQSSRSREADATLWPGSPPCLLPAQIPTPAADRCSVEGARADSPKSRHSDTIGARLMLQVRERWGHEHMCPTMVQLHVVEELLELFGINAMFDKQAVLNHDHNCGTAMAISCHALTGSAPPRAFQLHGWIQGSEVPMLVDSGISKSFLDKQLVGTLIGVIPLKQPA